MMKHLKNWKQWMIVVAISLAIPLSSAAASKKPHKKHHKKRTTVVTTTSVTANPGPKTPGQKVAHHVSHVGHKISYNTWRLAHPHQAAREAAAERAADSAREAADRQREGR